MLKRDELTNPNSCMNRARDDERTFVLLARDAAAPFAIRAWVEERIKLGKNTVTDPQIVEALDCAARMEVERESSALAGIARPSLQEQGECICTEAEIAQFGTPDPLCKAQRHPSPSVPSPQERENNIDVRLTRRLRASLHKVVFGAMKSQIDAHGSLAEGAWIGSAVKRIATGVFGLLKTHPDIRRSKERWRDADCEAECGKKAEVIAQLQRELAALRQVREADAQVVERIILDYQVKFKAVGELDGYARRGLIEHIKLALLRRSPAPVTTEET